MEKFIQPCRTMNDITSCLCADTHCVPTVEFTVENLNIPLDAAGYEFFNAPEINLFAAGRQTNQSGRPATRAMSKALSEPTISFDQPFVMLGLCVYAYAEPFALTIGGNQFNPQSAFAAAGHLPASPMNLRNALVPGLFGAGGFAGTVSPAQIQHGSPLWNAIWAFMHAYRLEMFCPTSGYELLMDESLADIGNCCSQMAYDGFGTSHGSHIKIARDLNDRLAGIDMPSQSGFGADPGYFVPWNCEQFNDGQIAPEVYVADPVAYGRPISMPAVEQWYKLACPIPFPSVPQPKLQIKLRKVDGDQDYSARLIQELMAYSNMSPVNGINPRFPLNDGAIVGDEEGYGGMTIFPHGQLRIGLGIKGFEVRESVCTGLLEAYKGKSFGELSCDGTLAGLVGQGGVVRTPYMGPGVTCGPIGSDGSGRR